MHHGEGVIFTRSTGGYASPMSHQVHPNDSRGAIATLVVDIMFNDLHEGVDLDAAAAAYVEQLRKDLGTAPEGGGTPLGSCSSSSGAGGGGAGGAGGGGAGGLGSEAAGQPFDLAPVCRVAAPLTARALKKKIQAHIGGERWGGGGGGGGVFVSLGYYGLGDQVLGVHSIAPSFTHLRY